MMVDARPEGNSGPQYVTASEVPCLTVRNLSKNFGKIKALVDIDIEVAQGEFCVLLGPSGCGKSTLLRTIAGLETPTRGRVFIHSKDVTNSSPGDRDVAMVFQNYSLYPHLSVFENMAFPLRLRKLPKEVVRAGVMEAAQLLQLEGHLDRMPAQLSGGQRQRVAIGRAIVRRPTVFLFDEPLSNLDAQLRATMRVEIAQLHRRLGATTIYVTHDQVEAMTLGDRIVILHDGTVQQIDTPEVIYKRPANLMVAGFVGSPSMNLIRGRVTAGEREGTAVFTSRSIAVEFPREAAQSREMVLGIRPEHIAVDPDGKIKGAVQFIEDLGSDRFLHVSLEENEKLVVRVGAAGSFSVGETIALTIDPNLAHLFGAPKKKEDSS